MREATSLAKIIGQLAVELGTTLDAIVPMEDADPVEKAKVADAGLDHESGTLDHWQLNEHETIAFLAGRINGQRVEIVVSGEDWDDATNKAIEELRAVAAATRLGDRLTALVRDGSSTG